MLKMIEKLLYTNRDMIRYYEGRLFHNYFNYFVSKSWNGKYFPV